MSDCSFTRRVLNVQRIGCSALWLIHGWRHVKLLPSRRKFSVHHTILRQFTVTPYSKPLRKMHARLAVTCHLRFWQNDWDLLRATVVTQGWNGYQNKSQHRKLTLLQKKILMPLL